MNISLPDKLRDRVEAEVATGMYANVSDFVRSAIRDRLRRIDDLVEELEHALEGGRSEKSPEQIVDEVLGSAR